MQTTEQQYRAIVRDIDASGVRAKLENSRRLIREMESVVKGAPDLVTDLISAIDRGSAEDLEAADAKAQRVIGQALVIINEEFASSVAELQASVLAILPSLEEAYRIPPAEEETDPDAEAQ